MPAPRRVVSLLAVLSLAACSNATLPNAATIEVDTVTLASLTGTPISEPSGYDLFTKLLVRTDNTSSFDFAYNVEDAKGRNVFLPLAALGLGSTTTLNPGFIQSTDAFDAITEAPSNGYVTLDTIPLSVGQVMLARSRLLTCNGLSVPVYAKLQVLSFDATARSVTIQIVANNNCGYHSLVPGTPTN